MAEETPDESESRWLLEPPGPGETHINVAIGSDVELSPEARATLETLISSLEGSEVSGYMLADGLADFSATCPAERRCAPYGRCRVLTKDPNCYTFTHCKIGGIA